MQTTAEPTPYPQINEVLARLLENVQEVLGEQFVGMYLYGSLASGDFDPMRSDIDFLVITQSKLPEETVTRLGAMHQELAISGIKWAKKLEGSYFPRKAVRRYNPEDAWHPSIGVDWDFGVNGHGSDWIIQLHILRTQGVCLAGPAPESLIYPVPPEALRQAVLETLQGWWRQQLVNTGWFGSRAYQAYAALTICRALYTLEHNEINSKPKAVCWALEALEPRWHGLIARALNWQAGDGVDDLALTLDFIRWAIDRAETGEAVRETTMFNTLKFRRRMAEFQGIL